MKNELRYVKQTFMRYEYDYKCHRYSLVTRQLSLWSSCT